MSALPQFDSDSPWGTYSPTGGARALIRACRAIPGQLPFLRQLTKLFRRPVKYGARNALDAEVWGLRLRLVPRGNISEGKLLFSPQFFDPEELRWLAGRLSEGSTFVDIGANAGAYSFWVYSRLGERVRILAVEPDAEMCRRLRFNLATNNIHNIELNQLALSDHQGQAVLQVKDTQRGQNTLEDVALAGTSRVGVPVEVETLVHFLQSRNIDRADALKIDIEGHEPKVFGHFFENAPASLWPKAVVTEFKPETSQAIRALFEGRGYRCVGVTKLNWMFERD